MIDERVHVGACDSTKRRCANARADRAMDSPDLIFGPGARRWDRLLDRCCIAAQRAHVCAFVDVDGDNALVRPRVGAAATWRIARAPCSPPSQALEHPLRSTLIQKSIPPPRAKPKYETRGGRWFMAQVDVMVRRSARARVQRRFVEAQCARRVRVRRCACDDAPRSIVGLEHPL